MSQNDQNLRTTTALAVVQSPTSDGTRIGATPPAAPPVSTSKTAGTLDIQAVESVPDAGAAFQDLTSPLFTALSTGLSIDGVPDGQGGRTITFSFAAEGDEFDGRDGVSRQSDRDWTAYEETRMAAALDIFAETLNITFVEVAPGTSSDLTVDLSRFDVAPFIAFIAPKETDYGTETDGRVPPGCGAHSVDQWAYT